MMTAEICNLETEVAEKRLQMQQVVSPQESEEQHIAQGRTDIHNSLNKKEPEQPKKAAVRFR